jgi:two-component system chemotaxis sensor kinase CheA
LAPGFSTKTEVSDLSGRGVGMDVVARAVDESGGTLDVDSTPGAGTTVTLSLPLTMAVSQVLLVEDRGETWGIPLESIVASLRVPRASIHRMGTTQMVSWRGDVLPLHRLGDLLGGGVPDGDADDDPEPAVLIVRGRRGSAAVTVQAFHERADVVLKPMQGVLARLRQWAGTAILGDGRVLLVADPKEVC